MKKLIFGLVLSAGMSGIAMAHGKVLSELSINKVSITEQSEIAVTTCYKQAAVAIYGCDDVWVETRLSDIAPVACRPGQQAGNVTISTHQLYLSDYSVCD